MKMSITKRLSTAATVTVCCLLFVNGASAQDVFGHWPFADLAGTTVTDASAYGHDGTLTNFADTSAGAGDPIGGSGWVTGGGLNFDGRSLEGETVSIAHDYVLTTLPTADLAGHSWTFEYVATHNNPSQNWSPYMGQAGGCCVFFGKRTDTNQLHANIAGIGGGDSAVIPNLTDGQPHHYALVFDDAADTLEFFFDGSSTGSLGGLTGALATDRGNMWLGGVAHNERERWDGIVYESKVTRDAVAGDGTGALAPADFINGGAPMPVGPPGETPQGNSFANPEFPVHDTGQFRVLGHAAHMPSADRFRVMPSANDGAGAVMTNGPLQLAPDYSFATTFTFEMGDGGGVDCCDDVPGADGLAFALHQDPAGTSALGVRGGGIGAYNGPNGITPALSVEFDTWHDGSYDPRTNPGANGNHVAVNVAGGGAPTISIAQTAVDAIPQLTNGIPKSVTIAYDGQTQILDVFMDEGLVAPTTKILSAYAELSHLFTGQDAIAGFTAATGGARHYSDLLSWDFTSPNTSANPPGPTTGAGEMRSYDDFSDVTEWSLLGNAAQAGDRIRLTTSDGNQAGSAVMTTPVEFFDTMQFFTSFDVELTDPAAGDPPGADGIVFFLAQSPHVGDQILGGAGGNMGFQGGTAGDGTAQNHLVIALDTWTGGFLDEDPDPKYDISIGTTGNTLLARTEVPVFNDGGIHHVIADYDGTNLNVRFWADSEVAPADPTVSTPVDLEELFGHFGEQQLYVGFTAGTGGAINNHDVLNFQLETFSSVTMSCDFNGDAACDISDIDLLMEEVAAGTNGALFDLNGDTVVDDLDRDSWLAEAGPMNGFADAYLVGDSDLDGTVNAGDLNNLALSWQADVHAWSQGNFTGAAVNSGDLNALALNWQQSIAAAANAAVPEPSAAFLLMIAACVFVRRHRE